MKDPAEQQRLHQGSGFLPAARAMFVAASRIPIQRWLAFALISLEAFAVGHLSYSTVYPAMIVCVAMYGTLSRLRFDMDRQRTYDLIALVAVIFVIKYMVTPSNPRYDGLIPSQPMGFTLAQYVLAMQCIQFFLKRRDDRLPFSFPGIGVIALVCAAMVSRESGERGVILALCVGFSVLSVLYCDASRRFIKVLPARHRGRPIATVLVLVAVGSLGWFMATSMHKYERQVEHFVNRFLQQKGESTSVGFSESSMLGSVSIKKDSNSQQTALRVVSSVEPGYFRARAYDFYENRKWLFNTEGRATYPQGSIPSAVKSDTHNGEAFQISDGAEPGTQKLEVWPDVDLGDTFAGPLRTSWLYADAKIVTVDTHDIMRSGEALAGIPYTVLVRDARERTAGSTSETIDKPEPFGSDSAVMLQRLATPPAWTQQSQRLVELSNSLFKDCETVNEKLAATRRYFNENYSYSLKVTPPAQAMQEPLEWFLLEQPPAHCEYFASGTAVLLRMAGVPCRYIVGFVVSEKNQYSGEWVARNEDAHAWVEAYDETVGWVTVETTPAAGIPDEASVSSFTQLYEYLRDEFHRIRIGWQQRGFASIKTSVKSLIMSPPGLGLTAVVALISGGVMFRRWRHRRDVDRAAYTASSPVIEQLQTARQKLDVTLKRVWRIRQPGETVDQYARQLATGAIDQHDPLTRVADWYAQYAALRFAPEPSQATVNNIAAQADTLATDLRKRVRHPDEQNNA
ncbi:MAG: transglutaminase-like domain-containing protein [Planctomycetales bacterium]